MNPPEAPDIPDRLVSEAFVAAPGPRRVLVYAPLAYSTPHFETDLEIAQRHLDLGDEVDLVLCDGDLVSCQLNPLREAPRCVQCISRSLQGAAQLSARVPVVSLADFLRPEDRRELGRLPVVFPDQAALRNYRYEAFDAGMATLSSVIDFVRSPDVDTVRYSGVINRTLRAAVATFLAIRRALAVRAYDRVYIYNGRWSMMRSAVRACQQAGIEFYTHERGSDFRKFALYRNTLPHDKPAFQASAREAWELAGDSRRAESLAHEFFHACRQRVEKTWFSYVKAQEAGRVPVDWNRAARRVVYFTSSEFEYAAICEGTLGRIYPSQALAAPRIARLLAATSPDAHLWIRVHPNDNTPETAHKWQAATAGVPNITLILPDAKVDSYALLDGAERVLTFGSTLGIEATYWGKPAICADFSFYNGLDAQYEAASEAELAELLAQPDLPPKPRANALIFGYYLNTFGAAFRHFSTGKISDYAFESPFRGRCLKPDFDDLRRRLIGLYEGGEFRRAVAVARVCVEFRPADDFPHAVCVLGLLRLGAVPEAIGAMEAAAGKLSPAQLELLLKKAGQGILDSMMPLAQRLPGHEFSALAGRVGAVMRRAPAFESIGRKFAAMGSGVADAPAVAAGS